MEGKDNLESLIISYLLGELNELDQADLMNRINSDEKSRQIYEDIKKTVKLVGWSNTVKQVDLQKEWDNFREAKLLSEHPEIFLNEAERFGSGIIREVHLRRKNRIFRIVSLSAIAASVILAIAWGVTFFERQKIVGPGVVTRVKAIETRQSFVSRHLTNYSEKARYFFLEDSSEVWLAASSVMDFREPFEAHKRDIHLTGSACFKVAKNKAKPFTVYSAGISTTALGTRFTVTAYKNSNRILVALHEGKVVVKGVDDLKYTIGKDYYLVRGQQFVYEKNRRQMLAHVENIPAGPETADTGVKEPLPVLAADKPSIPGLGKGSWFMFNNQSLLNVFEQLKRMYSTEIVYNKEEISKMYFIGTFSQSDSLDIVLKQIAVTNNLIITKEHQKFIVSIHTPASQQ